MARSREKNKGRFAAPRRFTSRALVLAVVVFTVGTTAFGLQATGALKAPRQDWSWSLPQGFPQPRVPAKNKMSRAKVEIGHRLFYDTRLSGNGTQSCSSCHFPELAFTDGRTTPVGSTGDVLARNAPSVANSAYHRTFTWANPALTSLESQMDVPLFGTNPVEMGINDKNKKKVLGRIKRDPWYAKRFPRVYRWSKKPVNWFNIIRSISAFQRSIVTGTSKYNRFLRGKAELTSSERSGLNLFMGEDGECHHCHGSFIFEDQATYIGAADERLKFHNTGLYNVGGTGAYPFGNRGLFEITGKKKDMGAFRAPSLLNVARTAPYMHDGSVKTLMDVVDIYARGGRLITEGPYAGDGALNPHKNPLISGIKLSEQDKKDIVAFLRTLTEMDYSKDPRFADPFK
ncbi:MAG: di-heme enzyme [Solirubrobacterales bacterium]|nr:di-heme enzyme [Solirubrobacterales bacterium]